MLDENNPSNNKIKIEDIYSEDNLFDDTDSKGIKKVSDGVIEEINFGDNIEIPSDDEVAVDEPKKIKIIPNPNGVRLASNRIIKKYRKQRQKGSLKKTNKKSAEWLKKGGFLGRDDLQTIDYNNDVTLDDLETIDFNNDTQMTELSNIDKIELKKTSATQQAVKKIIRKYRKLKRKSKPTKCSEPNKKSKSRNNDIMFIKQIPMHPRGRLKKLNKLRKTDEVKFIKQLSLHPRDRLKRKGKEELDNYNELSKRKTSKNYATAFIKQVPIHPRDRLTKLEALMKKLNSSDKFHHIREIGYKE